MNGFSRTMPPPNSPWKFTGWILLVGFLTGLAFLIYLVPWSSIGLAAIALWIVVLNKRETERLKRIAAGRPGESICSFARAFDRHTVDPWVIRAVWDEIQSYLGNQAFPLRASDRIDEELHLDWEDLEASAEVIARRTGRTMEGIESNPYTRGASSVGDVVMMMNAQARLGGV